MNPDTILIVTSFLSLPEQIYIYHEIKSIRKLLDNNPLLWNVDKIVLEEMMNDKLFEGLAFISERYPIIGAESIYCKGPNGSRISLLDIMIEQERIPSIRNLLKYVGYLNLSPEIMDIVQHTWNPQLYSQLTHKIDILHADTLVFHLIEIGDKKSLDILIRRGFDMNTEHFSYAENPLTHAIDTNESMIPYLLDKGADPNDALIYAISSEKEHIARLLLSLGASFENTNYGNVIYFSSNALEIYCKLGGYIDKWMYDEIKKRNQWNKIDIIQKYMESDSYEHQIKLSDRSFGGAFDIDSDMEDT